MMEQIKVALVINTMELLYQPCISMFILTSHRRERIILFLMPLLFRTFFPTCKWRKSPFIQILKIKCYRSKGVSEERVFPFLSSKEVRTGMDVVKRVCQWDGQGWRRKSGPRREHGYRVGNGLRGVGITQPGFKPHHNHFVALSFSFPICKMGVIIVLAASGCSEDYMS